MAEIMAALARGPAQGADALDALADRLKAMARRLRDEAQHTLGGTGDRVRMQVVGPDGRVKYTAEAGHG